MSNSVQERFIIEQKYQFSDWSIYPYYPRGLLSLNDAQEAVKLAEKNDNDFPAYPKRQFQIVRQTTTVTREVIA